MSSADRPPVTDAQFAHRPLRTAHPDAQVRKRWRPDPMRILGEIVLWSAFLASGGHVYQVALRMGNPWPIALVHAVGLDGLVYVGINACRTGGRSGWVRGIICVIYGGGMSLAFNAASYSSGGTLPAWVIAMSMPVSLVLAVVAGHGAARARPPTADPAPAPARPAGPRRSTPAEMAAGRAPMTERPQRPDRPPTPPPVSSGARPESALRTLAREMYVGGKPIEEIAASVGRSKRTVNGWTKDLRSVRKTLRDAPMQDDATDHGATDAPTPVFPKGVQDQ